VNLSLKSLEQAVAIRREIDRLEKRLSSLLVSGPASAAPVKQRRASNVSGSARADCGGGSSTMGEKKNRRR